MIPETYSATADYNYVTIDGTDSVCYAQTQPSLTKLTPKNVNVMASGKKVKWTCYNYDETYFTVTP